MPYWRAFICSRAGKRTSARVSTGLAVAAGISISSYFSLLFVWLDFDTELSQEGVDGIRSVSLTRCILSRLHNVSWILSRPRNLSARRYHRGQLLLITLQQDLHPIGELFGRAYELFNLSSHLADLGFQSGDPRIHGGFFALALALVLGTSLTLRLWFRIPHRLRQILEGHLAFKFLAQRG